MGRENDLGKGGVPATLIGVPNAEVVHVAVALAVVGAVAEGGEAKPSSPPRAPTVDPSPQRNSARQPMCVEGQVDTARSR
mmetsp:Transcript_15893/g.45918  ORF Transcript_15893/g.45918 Transcript_15893/m.45918 type:complete len:80 (+) Transcript_15893:310-549(+)